MSELTLTIRDLDRSVHGRVPAADVQRAIASLAAEPETIEELDEAMDRFTGDAGRSHFSGFTEGDDEQPAAGGCVIVDLAARLVAGESAAVTVAAQGSARDLVGDHLVSYQLGEHWQVVASLDGWQQVAARRRASEATRPRIDAREILFGRPLIDYLDTAMTVAIDHLDRDEAVSQVHAEWLTTSRSDLADRSPRDVVLERCDAIMHDIASREHQWSARDACPPGLQRTSAAYRYAGFGTHEIVVYYDLIRELLKAWLRWHERGELDAPMARRLQLEQVRDAWLQQPNDEYEGRSPENVIEKERRRIPEGMSGADAAIDCDCPICQMMAEDSQPYFWGLDGAAMEDDFAFSFHQKRESWEAEQQEWAELDREAAESSLPLRDDPFERNGIWQRCFLSDDSHGDMSLAEFVPIATFGFAAMIGELNQDIRELNNDAVQSSSEVKALNRMLGNLREALSGSPELIDPTLERLIDELASLAVSYPSLEEKCRDLANRLEEFPNQLAASAARS